jgi:hypothetical protein
MQTEITMATTGNLDAIQMEVDWNADGVLSQAVIKADGIVIASLTLVGSEGEIPGFEVPIILGITGFTIIAIILYGKKKNRSK